MNGGDEERHVDRAVGGVLLMVAEVQIIGAEMEQQTWKVKERFERFWG